jgi:hypothetical protein
MTVGVLSAPVAIAVADENDTNANAPYESVQQHAALVQERVNAERRAVRAERQEKAEKRAKKRAKVRKKKRAAAAQAQVAQAPAAAPQGQAAGGSTASAGLESIAACESGGDPSAVSADGQYRGKYQFDQQTWASVGGSGDPAAAPEAEQDQRAAMLQAQAGSSPWPVCGG